ncbi:hypothetical protein MC885_008799 [Smutsia gigantea]|nr:hypothetical protein MC885_008799 [Smutsia gigantea]
MRPLFLSRPLISSHGIQIVSDRKARPDAAWDMEHERMICYRQDPALGLQQLYFSYGIGNTEKGDDVPEGYRVSREKKEAFSLTVESASTNQTAVYLCASSKSTALQSHILSHKKGRCSVFGALLSQKPSRAICQRGTSMVIQCQVDSQVSLMFWYRQHPGQGLMLMATANQGSEATYESGFAKDKFPISRPNLTFSVLTVSNVSLEDSSLYFCSSEAQRWAPIRDLSKNLSCLLASSHPDEPADPARAGWRGKPQL